MTDTTKAAHAADASTLLRGCNETVRRIEEIIDKNWPHRLACRDLAEAVEVALSEARGRLVPDSSRVGPDYERGYKDGRGFRADYARLRSENERLASALREILTLRDGKSDTAIPDLSGYWISAERIARAALAKAREQGVQAMTAPTKAAQTAPVHGARQAGGLTP